MSCAEALRRCPRGGLRPAAPHALPRLLAGGLDGDPRGRADRRAHRARRGLPRPRRGRARTSSPRGASPRRCRPPCAARPRLTCSLGVATVQGRREGRLRPAQAGRAHRRPAGREAAFLAPFDVRLLPGVGPRAEERLRAAGIADDRRARRARRRARSAACSPARSGTLLRDRARGHRPARARDAGRADLDLDRGDLRAGHRRPRAAARRAPAHGRAARRAPRPGRARRPAR